MKKFIGSKSFYKNVLKVTLPIMIQQILINVVSLVDNLMVGQLNDDVISGVYIGSQIIFVINMMLFGSIEGASIFFAQFYGSKDSNKLKQCFNFKLYSNLIFAIIGFVVMFFAGEGISRLFVNETRAGISATYLKIYSICLLFFVLTNVIGTCFREINKSSIPMLSSMIGIVVNIILNYVFMFVLNWGYVGAAIATVIARFLEALTLFIFMAILKPIFINNIFKNPHIEKTLFSQISKKSIPLVINEFMWALGQITLVFAYSKVSHFAPSALSISSTFFNLCYISVIALGNGIAVIQGNTLGANLVKQAKEQVLYFITLSIFIALIMATTLFIIKDYIVDFYNVSEEAKHLAVKLMTLNSCFMILYAYNAASFFIIRSGGFTAIVLIFDSCFSWFIQVPVALLLAFLTNLELPTLFLLVNTLEVIKVSVGTIILKSGKWIRNLTVQPA